MLSGEYLYILKILEEKSITFSNEYVWNISSDQLFVYRLWMNRYTIRQTEKRSEALEQMTYDFYSHISYILMINTSYNIIAIDSCRKTHYKYEK